MCLCGCVRGWSRAFKYIVEPRVLMLCNSVVFNLVHLRNDSQLFMEEFAPLINVVEGLTFWTRIPERVLGLLTEV